MPIISPPRPKNAVPERKNTRKTVQGEMRIIS